MVFQQKLAGLLLFLLTGLFFAYPMGDADFGWHLRYGETELQEHRIIRTNEFSTFMPGFAWANHSWGFDIILSQLFGHDRFWLLSIVAGLLVATSLCINLPPTKSVSAMFLTTGIFWYFGSELLNIGLRSQLISLLLTAILWRLLHTKQYKYIPLLFLIWSNLHGQFIVGLGLLALAIIPKPSKPLLLTLVASCLVTLINPFGFSLWTTALGHLNDPNLKYIYEWMPWEFNRPRMWVLLLVSAVTWWQIIKQKTPLHQLLPLSAITLLALTSRRIIPYYLILILPILTTWLDQLIKPFRFLAPCFGLGLTYVALSQFYRHDIFHQSWDRYCATNVMCSEAAVNFIQTQSLTGTLFNSYRLGGHLIYRLPQMKPMIDGRMTVWRSSSGQSPFEIYSTIVYNWPGGLDLFQQINPDFVLIHPQYPFTQVLTTQLNWPIIYQDTTVTLFKNPQKT